MDTGFRFSDAHICVGWLDYAEHGEIIGGSAALAPEII